MEDSRRRLPAVARKISEIKPDDIRVRLLGTVIDVQGDIVILDDGTKKINITFEEPVKAGPNQFVRVLGRVMPMKDGVEIQGELIQDMSALDKEMLKKVEELEKAQE